MAEQLPDLYSHCANKVLTVLQASQDRSKALWLRVAHSTRKRSLSRPGRSSQDKLKADGVTGDQDKRLSLLIKRSGDLDAPAIYKALKTAHSGQDEWAKFVCQNHAPPGLKFFAWLLSQGRIQ